METTKSKIIKLAGTFYVISKILYLLSCAVCVAFVILAIVLSCTGAVKTMTKAETAVVFSTLALYSFFCIGLFWNVESIFKSIKDEEAPFGDRVSHYLKKIAIFVILMSVVPAIVGSTVMRIVDPSTQLVFPVEFSGVITALILFVIGIFFKYGKELQTNEDETL